MLIVRHNMHQLLLGILPFGLLMRLFLQRRLLCQHGGDSECLHGLPVSVHCLLVSDLVLCVRIGLLPLGHVMRHRFCLPGRHRRQLWRVRDVHS